MLSSLLLRAGAEGSAAAWAGSLKTEEKTKLVGQASQEDEPTIGRPFRLTHQCTNWELVRTGQDECLPTIERCSLERR